MSYEILWHPKVLKNLERLPKDISERVVRKVEDMKENPFLFLEHFEGKGCYCHQMGFVTAIDFVIMSFKKGEIDAQSARIKIEKLDEYGRYDRKMKSPL